MKIIWDRQETCQGQTETVHGTVRGTRYTVHGIFLQRPAVLKVPLDEE